ncbi:hypothetical protein BGZ46_009051 [Entomortierella lignicola]|nr:hypothetical protein BGZ46_009051 [Entomortierella lignicola]
MTRPQTSTIWSYFPAITLGLLSSSCCVIQLILNIFSIGCAGFSILTPFRPLFTSLSVLLIAFTFYKYRLSTRTATTLVIALILTASPELVAVHNQTALQSLGDTSNSLLLPINEFFQKLRWDHGNTHQIQKKPTPTLNGLRSKQAMTVGLVKYEIEINGMACEACASRLRQHFISKPGVENVKVFFAEKRMEIWSRFDPSSFMYSESSIQNMVAEVDSKYSARTLSVYSVANNE